MSQIGATPEIQAALNLCVEEIWANHDIEESTGAIRRDEIRRYMQTKLQSLDDAVLSNEDFDMYFKQVDSAGVNKLSKQ